MSAAAFAIRPGTHADRLPLALLSAVAGTELAGSLHLWPTPHGFADLGMAVAREWRGQHSAAAIALYRSYGFVEEGRRVKQYRRRSGELWDTIEMGLLLD